MSPDGLSEQGISYHLWIPEAMVPICADSDSEEWQLREA